MRLTANQENFCMYIVEGKTQYESYCLAYPNQAKSSKREVLDVRASELINNSKISVRIAELRKPFIDEFNYTVKDAFNEFTDALNMAKNKDDVSNVIKAIENKAKLLGLYEKDNSQKGGVTINMPSIEVNGEELEFKIGEDVNLSKK